MYNIIEELGYDNISKFINSDDFRKYVEKKMLNRTVGEGKLLINDIITNTLKLNNKMSIIYGVSDLNNDIEDYLKDIIRKRKIDKIINKMKNDI